VVRWSCISSPSLYLIKYHGCNIILVASPSLGRSGSFCAARDSCQTPQQVSNGCGCACSRARRGAATAQCSTSTRNMDCQSSTLPHDPAACSGHRLSKLPRPRRNITTPHPCRTNHLTPTPTSPPHPPTALPASQPPDSLHTRWPACRLQETSMPPSS
jgi:hypothetical protein